MAIVHMTLIDTPAGGVEVHSDFLPSRGAPCTKAQAAALEIYNRTRKDWGMDTKGAMPACPKCGNNHQVWVNQVSGVLTCHRAYCDTQITQIPTKPAAQENHAS